MVVSARFMALVLNDADMIKRVWGATNDIALLWRRRFTYDVSDVRHSANFDKSVLHECIDQ